MHRFTPPTPVNSAHRTAITLVLEAWEIECCVPPPTVGEETFFTLSFHADPRGLDVAGLACSYPWTVHPLPARLRDRDAHDPRAGCRARADGAGTATQPAVVTWAGVSAYWSEASTQGGAVTVDGFLTGHRHGGILPQDVPVVGGEVTRVQVLRRVAVGVEPSQLQPVPGTVRVREVQSAPRRFEREVIAGAVPYRVSQEEAVVIDLRVSSTRSRQDLA